MLARLGHHARMASPIGLPRTLAVSAANTTSSTSPKTAPTSEAATSPPNSDGTAATSVACAARPITAPLDEVVCSCRSPTSIAALGRDRVVRSARGRRASTPLPPTAAASGPKSTAAKRVGSRCSDCSSVEVRPRLVTANRTLMRSAMAAASGERQDRDWRLKLVACERAAPPVVSAAATTNVVT